MFKLGLIVNPLAGIGGPVGLKGSDGAVIVEQAFALGASARAPERAQRALERLRELADQLQIYCFDGAMGGDWARNAGFQPRILGVAQGKLSSAEDTERAARLLCERGVDLLLFVGGDGTARNICRAVSEEQPAVGVPAGVKMHSGVYAISPEAAGELVQQLITGQLVSIRSQEVRDIDEEAFRRGVVKARYYGELSVPESTPLLQQVKQGGVVHEELVLADIAAELIEQLEEDTLYIVGPGSTTRALMEELGLDNTLLGVDVILNQQLLVSDISGPALEALLASREQTAKLIITAIGGQGHILGRGNQQLTPTVLRRLGRDNIQVIATPAKLQALQGRPLLVDSNDPELDASFCGYQRVLVGYQDYVLYPIGSDPLLDKASSESTHD